MAFFKKCRDKDCSHRHDEENQEQHINFLGGFEDICNIDVVRDESKWELLEVTIDSGACDHVIPHGMAKRFKLFETDESRNGKGFSAANNSVIKNYGTKRVSGLTGEWCPIEMTFHAADVKRALASTTKLKKDGKMIIIYDELG